MKKFFKKKCIYLNVVIISAEYVENDTALMASSRAIATHNTLAHANTLISHDELIEYVLAVSDTVFNNAFINRVTTLNETV